MAHQFGITNAVATLGTALTDNHVAALKRFTRKVVLVFDGDAAGKAAAEKSVPRFIAQDVDLRILTLTDAKDPADFLIAQGADAFRSLIETAAEAWEYKLRLCIERIGLSSVDARQQIGDEMLSLLSLAPRLAGTIRENIILTRLEQLGLSDKKSRELLATSRRKGTGAAPGPAGRQPEGGAGCASQRLKAGSRPMGPALYERELLEILLSDPTTVEMLRQEVAAADFKNEDYRGLLELCFQLAEEGTLPSYEKLIGATEDADLKGLIVTLEESAREKGIAQKLRLDAAAEEKPARPELLCDRILTLKRQRRAEEQEVWKGKLAAQSGPVGTLDPAQIELLRRSAEIHAERAKARPTT
jgi:DNA primase